jgi:hypothetical protein
MPETLQRLRPDRDLQCYFERPSAVAALSGASATGFTVSGCWRQQFDWAVVEWNRDNVFEHPALRNLPEGDLSGLQLSYEEERLNAIAVDSALYPTVDWPYLRLWAEGSDGVERFYQVSLKRYATAVAGEYVGATAEFELGGSITAGDYVELAWEAEHYNYQVGSGDTLASAASALAQVITQNSTTVSASADGAQITLTYASAAGANANRIGVYGTVHGAGTEAWTPAAVLLAGGESPTRWRIDLDFGNLRDKAEALVPTTRVRKMRWTWSADLQPSGFERSEFQVVVSNWSVTGSGRAYQVAGPGSRRIEDDDESVSYTGSWSESRGNFSGGSIRETVGAASLRCVYRQGTAHRLYLGTRRAPTAGAVAVKVDGAARQFNLALAGEDVLVRLPLGEYGAGEHTVEAAHAADGSRFYFDFLEVAIPSGTLPSFEEMPDTTAATDWDTDHSIAIAPERTAWLMRTLGFKGRANHYVGALWFYELDRPGHEYAAATVQFSGTPEWSVYTRIRLGPTVIEHLNLIGDTAASVAKSFEFLINQGATGVWAEADGASLTITSRAMGTGGNGVTVTVETNSEVFTASGDTVLAGGVDGAWRTDLAATPRVNRAARDWARSFYVALKNYDIEVTAAFSLELQHGDDSAEAGIAQRYPDGSAAWLNTPALQTNFSPASTDYWKQVYADMAAVMAEAGVRPYLQFGEVQWWYFPNSAGMPFYDAYTTSTFETRYGRTMRIIASPQAAPAGYAEEMVFLPSLIGDFTDAVMAHVRTTHPQAVFEVLYPPDVNDAPITRIVNLPSSAWTAAKLECFKTENFTFTGDRDLDKAGESIRLPLTLGFPRHRSSHLVGIWEYTTPWKREHRAAQGEGLESVVLFALDQFCLIGYGLPLERGGRRAYFQGI